MPCARPLHPFASFSLFLLAGPGRADARARLRRPFQGGAFAKSHRRADPGGSSSRDGPLIVDFAAANQRPGALRPEYVTVPMPGGHAWSLIGPVTSTVSSTDGYEIVNDLVEGRSGLSGEKGPSGRGSLDGAALDHPGPHLCTPTSFMNPRLNFYLRMRAKGCPRGGAGRPDPGAAGEPGGPRTFFLKARRGWSVTGHGGNIRSCPFGRDEDRSYEVELAIRVRSGRGSTSPARDALRPRVRATWMANGTSPTGGGAAAGGYSAGSRLVWWEKGRDPFAPQGPLDRAEGVSYGDPMEELLPPDRGWTASRCSRPGPRRHDPTPSPRSS